MSNKRPEQAGRIVLLFTVLALAIGIGTSVGIAFAAIPAGGKTTPEEAVQRPQPFNVGVESSAPKSEIVAQIPDERLRRPERPAQVLYDQYDAFSYSAVSSQNFEQSYDSFDDQGADDFVVPVGEMWIVDRMEVAGVYAGGPADSVNVFFYTSSNQLPATPVFSLTNIIPDSGLETGDFDLRLGGPVILSSGSYWVSVQANQNHESNGQWFWRNRSLSSNNAAAWRNPGGGFAHSSCLANWGRRASQCHLSEGTPDQVFRLIGTALGTPTATSTGTSPTPTSTFVTGPTATPAPPSATGTATNTRTPAPPTRTGTRTVPSPVSTLPIRVGTRTALPVATSTPPPSCGLYWREMPSANVGFFGDTLYDVDGLSANDQWAVGLFNNGRSSQTLVLHWDGNSWFDVPSPAPGSYSVLTKVKAIAANDVWATGYYITSEGGSGTRGLAIHWDGSQWRESLSTGTGVSENRLTGVSGTSPQDVWAVGQTEAFGTQRAVAFHWNGTQWESPTLPDLGEDSALYAVEAISLDDVWAAGYSSGTAFMTLMLHWDGTEWSIVPGPNLPSSLLTSMTALSPQDVWAAGYTYSPPDRTVTMHWDGTEWSIVPSPNVQGENNLLNDIDAVSTQEVWAVGYVGTYDRSRTLIEQWDGSQWSIVPSANVSPWINSLYGVSAVGYRQVLAAGYYEYVNGASSTTQTLVERYNDPCATPTPTSAATNTPTNTATSTYTSTPTETATPAPTSCPVQFVDVDENNTFYPAVRCLACRGIISGYADGTFKPNNLVTRGQLAKIVSNAANFTEDPGAQIFEDVPDSQTFYQWINRLTRRTYMGGYPCGGPGEPCVNGDRPYFRPVANATRGQTSKIVANAAQYNETPTEQTFEDVPATHPFYQWIQRLASHGVMGGYECGGPGEPCISGKPYFRPYNNVTRGQSAKIVANTFYPDCHTP